MAQTRMDHRRWWVVSVLCSLAVGLLGRGSLGHVVLTILVTLYVAVPATGIAITCYLASYLNASLRKTARTIGAVAAMSALPLVSLIPGLVLAEHDIRDAKAYCESMIPSLDAYRAQRGEFPADLTLIANGAAPPHLLRPQWALGYKTYDGTFSFTFSHPNRFLKYFWYDGANRTWRLAG